MKSAKASRKRKPPSAKRKAGHGGTEKIQSAKPNNERLSAFYGTGPVAGLGSAPKAKLSVSRADDPQEKEADALAERVVAGGSVPSISRAPAEEKAEASRAAGPEEKPMQTAARQPEEEQVEAAHRQEEEETVGTVRRQEEEGMADMLRRQGEDEEVQAVRRQEEAKEAATLRKQEEEEAQTAAFRQDETEEEETAQAQRTGAPVLSEESERKIQEMRGGGDPLPENVRAEMEEKFGADFSSVRVHTDGTASDLCREINARAFTVGHDIFFASGEFAPETKAGKRLLAHELTHVAQNRDGANRVMRLDDAIAPANNSGPSEENCGRVGHPDVTYTIENRDLNFNKIKLPPFKVPLTPANSIVRHANAQRVEATQNEHWNELWRNSVGERSVSPVATTINGILDRQYRGQPRPTVFSFRARNGFRRGGDAHPVYRNYIGTPEQVARELCFPTWNKNGDWTSFEVDHRFEIQLGGQNQPDNLWLLNATTNTNSGRSIWNFLRNKMAGGVAANENAKAEEGRLSGTSSSDQVLRNYNIFVFEPVALPEYSPSDVTLPPRYFWEQEEIAEGAHTRVPRFETLLEIDTLDQDYGNNRVKVFPEEGGGVGKLFYTSTGQPRSTERDWLDPWVITRKEFYSLEEDAALLGRFHLRLPASRAADPIDEESIAIHRFSNAENTGYLSLSSDFLRLFGDIQIRGLSPVRIDLITTNGGGGIAVVGKVIPQISLLSGLDLDFAVRDGEISVWRTFGLGDFEVPSPFSVEEISLEVGVSTERGLFVGGRAAFEIENVGSGSVESAVGSDGTFALSGEFEFDERLFGEGTQARIRIGYADNAWSMGGTLTIPEDKVPGVQSATINVNYAEGEGFSAEGTAELDVPGVESGTLSISQSEEEGWVIGGSFDLSPDTPGIRGGTISAQVRERPDGEGYAVSARGEAQPDIPGINSNLVVEYDDGAFTAEVEADYSRGMLSGRLNAGVTNRSVGEDGQLSETAEPGNPLIVYGGGQLTIQIAPWLQGTAGVQFAPNGEITVTGEIGLPDELEIFPRREIEKSIFSIAVQAPIVPGIVAEVGGGLGAVAGIGPGVIDELRLGITYNPEREEDTTITGDAHLSVPADAGLRLSVRAGIGLGITGASVTGGLEIGGTLGIEGAAEAGVHVEWNPTSGLDLEANVSVHAQPSFTFDINGYVSVRALGFSVYDQTWELASFTFGSDYRFGINLPIHYREGEPFDISLDDVEFEVPDIDTDELLSGLIDRIA